SFGEVNDSFGNVLRLTDRTHGGESLHEFLLGLVEKMGVNDPGSYRVKADVALCIFVGKAQDNRIQSSLGDRRDGGWKIRDGIGRYRRGDASHAAASALRKHLLHGKLSDEDEAFEVGGDKAAKLGGRVIRERFARKDAGIA